jgi:hypothetical protein
MNTVGLGTKKVGGLLVSQGTLYGTSYLYYDGSGSQVLSHYSKTSLVLSSSGTARGMYQVGTVGAGYVSGYMASVPPEWQASLGGSALTGNCCLSIIGRTSSGPAVFAFNPSDVNGTNPVPAKPLVYYPLATPLASGFTLSTNITGAVFPGGTRSVLFFGKNGLGAYCYGETTANGGPCYDPALASKGTHMYPYAYQVWAYDVNDLLSVKNGNTLPWAIRPYGIWTLTLPFADIAARVGGAAWDPQSRRLFLSALYGDGSLPVVHVFKVEGGSPTKPPAPPSGLRVQ